MKVEPLRVDWVQRLGPAGRLGLTLCPGRRGASLDGQRVYRRDVDEDVAALRALDTQLVVSLLEPHEYEALGARALPAALLRARIQHIALPVPDGGVPPDRSAWGIAVLYALGIAARGRAVVHCRAGLGRTGTFVGCCLRAMGWPGPAALRLLELARGPRCPETAEQEAFVLAY